VSFYFYPFVALVGLLLLLFLWSLRTPRQTAKPHRSLSLPENCGSRHATHLPQIQQALAKADYEYVSQKGPHQLERRIRKERRRIALAYLAGLREDFQTLLDVARIIAVLSPELAAVHEFEKLRLTMKFRWHFELLRIQLWAGSTQLPQLSGLADVVSGLSMRMEKAIKELGERAALASKLASSLGGRGVDAL
jgi:hypothetical protein